MGKVKKIFIWSWRGLNTWSILVSFGVPSIIRGIWNNFFMAWPLYQQLLIFGGAALILLGLLSLFSPYILNLLDNKFRVLKTKEIDGETHEIAQVRAEDAQGELLPFYERQSGVIVQGFEFFSSRDNLVGKYPISDWIKTREPIWGLWVTGTAACTNRVMEKANITKLILPHPGTITDEFAKGFGRKGERVAKRIIQHIMDITREALDEEERRNAEILHWHNLSIGNTITIGNPESPGSWFILETLIAGTDISGRPSIRVENIKPFEDLFKGIKGAFDYYWKHSQPPTEEEVKKFRLKD
jgi:hypothetical protein